MAKKEDTKKDNQEATKVEVTKTKKNKKVIIIAAIITTIVVIGVAIGGYFLYEKVELEKPLEQEWGQAYYVYIKSSISKTPNSEEEEKFSLKKNNAKVEFCDIEDVEKPVMLFEYKEGDDIFTNILYLDVGGVNMLTLSAPSQVEYLYEIANKKFEWYLHESMEEGEKYTNLAEEINYFIGIKEAEDGEINVEYPQEQVFSEDDKTVVKTVDGDELSIPKYDETFIKTDVVEKNLVDFNADVSEKELKNTIKETANNLKNEEELEEEVKAKVEEKEAEIIAKQEEMQKADEERKQKEEEERKAEEERKRQEELAKGLQVGSHRLKYGTYKMLLDYGEGLYGTIKIEPDGKCHVNSNCDTDSIGKEVVNEDTTYTVETHVELELPGIYSDCIVFKMKGKKVYFEVVKDNAFSDQWHGYSYVGE